MRPPRKDEQLAGPAVMEAGSCPAQSSIFDYLAPFQQMPRPYPMCTAGYASTYSSPLQPQ
jgi:hypothetical protein